MLDILASEFLQAKNLWKKHRFRLQEGLWNPAPQNENVSLYVLSWSAQRWNYSLHFIFFFSSKLCVISEIEMGGKVFYFFISQCAFRNPLKNHKCVWNKFSSHMNSNHNILPNLPRKQAKNNLASQLVCRKTTTAWKTLNNICTCFWFIRNISLLYKRESYELTVTKRLSRTMIMDVRLMCTSSLECKLF